MSSADRVLLLLFQSVFLLFLFLLWLLWLGLPKLLNSSGKSGHPYLIPDFKGNAFNFLPLRIMFDVGLLYMAFIMFRYVPSVPTFWRVFFFYHKWVLNFVKGFLCICWNNHMVFISHFVNMVYHIDLWILKNPFIAGI